MDFNILLWLSFYPFALYLMVDSGTDFAFRRPQMLFSLNERWWIDYEGAVYWLLLGRFLTGCLLIVVTQFWLQMLIIFVLLLMECLAGRFYLPKTKRE